MQGHILSTCSDTLIGERSSLFLCGKFPQLYCGTKNYSATKKKSPNFKEFGKKKKKKNNHISHLHWDSGLVANCLSSSLLFSQVLENSAAIYCWIPFGMMWGSYWYHVKVLKNKARRRVCHNDNMGQLELSPVVDNQCAKGPGVNQHPAPPVHHFGWMVHWWVFVFRPLLSLC